MFARFRASQPAVKKILSLYRLCFRAEQHIWRLIPSFPAAGDNGRFAGLTIRGKTVAGFTIGRFAGLTTRGDIIGHFR